VAAEAPSAYKVTNPLGALSPLDTVTWQVVLSDEPYVTELEATDNNT
jgi:hypothetical protein